MYYLIESGDGGTQVWKFSIRDVFTSGEAAGRLSVVVASLLIPLIV